MGQALGELYNLEDYCAAGTAVHEGVIPVAKTHALRYISFEPPRKPSYPPVVFVAGWISQIEAWQIVLRDMTRDFHVYYVETRDKNSAVITGKVNDYSVAALGEDLAAAVEKFGFGDDGFIMFGSSLGGTSILDCSTRLPARPLALVLIGPNAEFRFPLGGRAAVRLFPPRLYVLLRPYIKWYLRTFRLDVKTDRAQYLKYCRALDAADPWKLKKGALSLMRYTIWDQLDGNAIPSLIIGGSHDILHEPGNLMRMVDELENGAYLDLKTNRETHSAGMVDHMRGFIDKLSAI